MGSFSESSSYSMGGAVAECGVASTAVVEDLDALEDRVGELDSGLPLLAVEKFDLHRGPEAFHHGVVEAVGDRPKDGRRPAERIFSPKT
jgi:hypothetical protein